MSTQIHRSFPLPSGWWVWAGACVLIPGILAGEAVSVAETAPDVERLRQLRLEDILNTEVTSVSKRPEKLFDSATAIYVINNEDIRRSGATSIPEALRLAPGLTVAQADSHTWGVASRGFNDVFTDKLQVLVDGRSVYHNVNGAVWWSDVQYLLEDIDRIEVIRGPGGTIWGANAVNGVINIITKSAKDTQGAYATAAVGTEERAQGAARYGAKLGDDLYGRVFVQYDDEASHPGGNDRWSHVQGGARVDWEPAAYRVTFEGDYYHSSLHGRVAIPSVTPPYLPWSTDNAEHEGGNLIARLERIFSEDSEFHLQIYADHDRQTDATLGSLQETSNIDVDLQHRFSLPLHQSFTYGLEYRYLPTSQNDMALWTWNLNERNSQLFTGFLQDEIGLVPDHLRLTLGTKVEHNDFTGWELQPNARLSWRLAERQTVWAAVSRAVAIPSIAYNDIQIHQLPTDPVGFAAPQVPVFVGFTGNPELQAQELMGYELGYRIQISPALSFDLASFYNCYDQLVYADRQTPQFYATPAPHVIIPSLAGGAVTGETAGAELSATWRAADWCRLTGYYAYLYKELRDRQDAVLTSQEKDPANQASLRVSFDLPRHITLDLWGRFVDHLPYYDIDSYVDLDVRVAWQPKPYLELSIVGQNLIQAERFEFGYNSAVRTQVTPVPRGVYGQVTFRF